MSTRAPDRALLRITNDQTTVRTVVLEPWTTEARVKPGGSIDIAVEGDFSLPLGIEISGETIIVYSLDSQGALLTFAVDSVTSAARGEA